MSSAHDDANTEMNAFSITKKASHSCLRGYQHLNFCL
jgi:hypothetical protein